MCSLAISVCIYMCMCVRIYIYVHVCVHVCMRVRACGHWGPYSSFIASIFFLLLLGYCFYLRLMDCDILDCFVVPLSETNYVFGYVISYEMRKVFALRITLGTFLIETYDRFISMERECVFFCTREDINLKDCYLATEKSN